MEFVKDDEELIQMYLWGFKSIWVVQKGISDNHNENYDLDTIIPRLKAYTTGKVVEIVTCDKKYELKGSKSLADNGPISGSSQFKKEDSAQC